VVAWFLLGLWTALALFYNVPLLPWAATILALAVAFLYASAFRERLFVRGRQGTFWRETRRSLAALAVTAAVAIWYFDFITPNPNQDWITKHAKMPHVEVVGDKVHVGNVRNFTWRTPTDFTPGYEDRVYDVSALSSMYFVISPIFDLEPVAHVWVCFGFSDGQHRSACSRRCSGSSSSFTLSATSATSSGCAGWPARRPCASTPSARRRKRCAPSFWT
jgi:hypothetical protein